MARAERAHPQADHSLRRGSPSPETGRRSLRAGAAGCFARPLPRHVRQDSLHAQPFLEYRHRLSLRVHGRVARTAVRQGRYLGSRVARCLLSGCDGSTAGIRLRKEPEETIKFIITYEFSLIVLFGLIDGKPDAVKPPAFSFESIFGRESTICSEHAYLCKTLVPYN